MLAPDWLYCHVLQASTVGTCCFSCLLLYRFSLWYSCNYEGLLVKCSLPSHTTRRVLGRVLSQRLIIIQIWPYEKENLYWRWSPTGFWSYWFMILVCLCNKIFVYMKFRKHRLYSVTYRDWHVNLDCSWRFL